MDADGGNAKQLTRGTTDSRPVISPDGKWVAFTEIAAGVYRVLIDGGLPVKIADIKNRTGMVISPDSRWLAYDYWTEGTERVHHLVVIPGAGGKPVLEVPFDGGTADAVLLAWSPTGDGVTYDRIKDGAQNIWKQPLSGGPAIQLTHFKSGGITSFAWRPDGTLLFALREDSSDVVLISDFH